MWENLRGWVALPTFGRIRAFRGKGRLHLKHCLVSNNYLVGLELQFFFISNNGTQFTSPEFAEFCKQNGVQHCRPPLHPPWSNGQAEIIVGIFKQNFLRMEDDNLGEELQRFLIYYSIIPSLNCQHGNPPAEIMFERLNRTDFWCFEPEKQNDVYLNILRSINTNSLWLKKQNYSYKYNFFTPQYFHYCLSWMNMYGWAQPNGYAHIHSATFNVSRLND